MDEELSAFEKGLILGVLIGEGHFGGDGKQPQITLKMHVRHEQLLRWMNDRVRWSRLFGPYHHAGRHFLQLMFRGPAISRALGPMLASLPWEQIDDHSYRRFCDMLSRYRVRLEAPEDVIVSRGSSP
jgi:hypothetical protein